LQLMIINPLKLLRKRISLIIFSNIIIVLILHRLLLANKIAIFL